MFFHLYKNIGLSINLNKGQYSSIFNPHIMIVRKQKWGYGVRFPPHWRVWSIELSRAKRIQNIRNRGHFIEIVQRPIIKSVLKIGRKTARLHVFSLRDGAWRVYYRPLRAMKTRMKTFG